MSKLIAKKISYKGQAKCKKLEAFFPEDIAPLDGKSSHKVRDVPSETREE